MDSRQLHRIAEPLLYQVVAITAGRCAKIVIVPIIVGGQRHKCPIFNPTTKGCNIMTFMHNSLHRPALVLHILSILRHSDAHDWNCLVEATNTRMRGNYEHPVKRLRSASVTGGVTKEDELNETLGVHLSTSVTAPLLRKLLQMIQDKKVMELTTHYQCESMDPFFQPLEESRAPSSLLPFDGLRASQVALKSNLVKMRAVLNLPHLTRLTLTHFGTGCPDLDATEDMHHCTMTPQSGRQELHL